jgi:hypothetical protein
VTQYAYTRHQTARGSRPDAVTSRLWLLAKNVSHLRLTYQIRLLTFRAGETQSLLVIKVPTRCKLSTDLQAFVKQHRRIVRIERFGS